MEHLEWEWISRVDIPSCQLMIGMGVPLRLTVRVACHRWSIR